ncbi:hypothetical protein FV229_13515 [Methylobacterium sp. WL120]|nr:hypothetical protein FV229_13515 [Methylobacterium sp. WL120]
MARRQDETVTADKIAQVQRLSSALAARVRYAQMVRGPILPAQVDALLAAAMLLQEHEVPWPSLLEQVLHDLAQDLEHPEPSAAAEP